MLFVVSSAGCSSDTPEDPTKSLLAQKKHLVNEINDLAVILYEKLPREESPCGSVFREAFTSVFTSGISPADGDVKLVIFGFCNVIENGDPDIWPQFASSNQEQLPSKEKLRSSFVEVLCAKADRIIVGEEEFRKELLKEELLKALNKHKQIIEDTLYELCNKGYDLMKVVKQIREST